MIRTLVIAAAIIAGTAGAAQAGSPLSASVVERPDLQHYFTEAGTDGTMVVYDPGAGSTVVVNAERAKRGYSPASTFKIVNSLIGLETGAVGDIDADIFKWDGRLFLVNGKSLLPDACDADLSLRNAFKLSCVTVYQQLARRIGPPAFARWLAVLDYGNGQVGGAPVDLFWLSGDLRITAWQQVAFLARLATGDLPVSPRSLRQVREIMVVESTPLVTLRAKTGYAYAATPAVGWWVGWTERAGQIHVFTLNLDMLTPAHAAARQGIGKSVLRDLGAL